MPALFFKTVFAGMRHDGARPRSLFCAAAIALLVGAASSRGDCVIDSAAFVYLHPYFEGKNWKVSAGDSLDIVLDSGVCSLKPATVAMASTRTGAVGVAADAPGNVSGIPFTLTPSSCSCCRPLLSSGAPVAWPVVAPGAILYPIRRAGGVGDTLLLAVAGGASRVLVHHVRISTATLITTDTLAISTPPSGPSITGIWGTSSSYAAGDSGIFVTGTKGLIRYFGFSGSAWGSEVVFDIVNTQNVSAAGGSFAATTAGRVYQRSGNTFSLVGQPAASTIRRIGATVGVADDGSLLISKGAAWNSFQTGMPNLRYANLVKTGAGSAAELLDSAWRYGRYTYSDSVTRIAGVVPAAVRSGLNSGVPFTFSGSAPETVSVTFHDADSNDAAPHVSLSNGATLISATTLNGMDPAAPCSVGVRYWADSTLTVILRSDSVVTMVKDQDGTFDFTCYSCYWSHQTIRAGSSWTNGNVLTIAAAQDTLKIVRSQISTAVQSVAPALSGSDVSIRATGGTLQLALSRHGIEEFRAIRLFTADGRLIASFEPSGASPEMTIPVYGLVCVQIILRNGASLTKVIPAVR